MADVDININAPADDNSVTGTGNKTAVELLSIIISCLVTNGRNENEDSFPHESILRDYGHAITLLTDPDGRQAIPESFIEMALDAIDRAEAYGISAEELAYNYSVLNDFAREAWTDFWEDAFTPPVESDMDEVVKDIAQTVENSLDAEDVVEYYITDADILERAKGREVTTANLFNPDGSPDPDGAFSERIFGPRHGVSCECGNTKSGTENGSVTVGEICPDCGTETRSCSDRKKTWAYALSPIPLLFGREDMVGAMISGLLDAPLQGLMQNVKNPLEPKAVVESMAKGEPIYAWAHNPNSNPEQGWITTWSEAQKLAGMRDQNGAAVYSVRGGIRGIEAALEYLDAHDGGKYVEGDRNSALYNAYSYCQLKIRQNHDTEKNTENQWARRRAADALADAQATYSAAYSFINDRKACPSELLLHAVPIPPPGTRPVNDRNGKTDLGDTNEGLQRLLQAMESFSRLSSQEGFGWVGGKVWQDACQRIYEAEAKYLDAIYSKIAGKAGLIRGRLMSSRSDAMMMAVIVPDTQKRGRNLLNSTGLRDVVSSMIAELPARGMRKMYEKEIRAVLKSAGRTPQEIKKALREPVGTMVVDEDGRRRRCDADLALEAVAAGYGSAKAERGTAPEIGRLFVPEGNPFGMSRSQARAKYDSAIRQQLRREGYTDAQIAEEMAKAPGTMEDEEPCAADRILEDICKTEQGGLVSALSRDPVIKTTGIQLAYVIPNFDSDVIKVHPLVMKGFDGDFDGDRLAAIRLMLDRAIRKAKKIMIQAFREDGTGDINHLPTLESLIGLYRMTKTYGDRPDYSLKYDGIITNVAYLEKSGDIRNGTALRATDVAIHRILRELNPSDGNETLFGGKSPKEMVGKYFAPGEAYGTDRNGNPVYSDKSCFVTESNGKFYLVDSFSDTVRVPLGATVRQDGIIKAGEPIASARMFRGSLKALEKELDRGTVTPMSRIILRDGNGEERETTAGRALVESLLPQGVRITGNEGISKKWISNMLDAYIDDRIQSLENAMSPQDAYLAATREAMDIADRLTEYGFGKCSKYFGVGASFKDFPSFLPIDTTTLTPDGRVPDTLEGQAEYKRLAKEKGVEAYRYIADFNTSYVADIIGSGEKGVGLVEAMVNRNVSNTYSGGTLAVTGGNVVNGLYGYRLNTADAESRRSNNKTLDVDKTGGLRNRMDDIVDGMLLEEVDDCGTTMYLEGPLTEKNLMEYEGRSLARDINGLPGLEVRKDTPLTKDVLKKLYTAGVRTIPYRSALTCRCQGVCSRCAGTNPNVLATPGDDIGHRAVAAVFQPLSQGIMDVAKRAMASAGRKDVGIEVLNALFDGRAILQRLKSMDVDYYGSSEQNMEPLVGMEPEKVMEYRRADEGSMDPDRLGRLLMARMFGRSQNERARYYPAARELDAISMAQILVDEIMEVANRKVPQIYAEIMAKRLIAAEPERDLYRNGYDDSRSQKRPMMSLTELVSYGLRGKNAKEVLNPGVFLVKGGKDAAVDFVSKSKATGLAADSISTALANATRGTEAHPAPPQNEENRWVLKKESRSRMNTAGRLYNKPVAGEIKRG